MLQRKDCNRQLRTFQVSADFADIEFYSLERGPVQIAYNLAFEFIEAWVCAGMTLSEFEAMPGTPMWLRLDQTLSKCHLLVWYRKHNRIKAVSDSANIRKSNKLKPSKTNFRRR